MSRAETLTSDKRSEDSEKRYLKQVLRANGYQNHMLSRKSKPLRNSVAPSDSFIVLPYFPGLTKN